MYKRAILLLSRKSADYLRATHATRLRSEMLAGVFDWAHVIGEPRIERLSSEAKILVLARDTDVACD